MVFGTRKALQPCSIAASRGPVPDPGRLIFEDSIQYRLLKFIIRMSQWHRSISLSHKAITADMPQCPSLPVSPAKICLVGVESSYFMDRQVLERPAFAEP